MKYPSHFNSSGIKIRVDNQGVISTMENSKHFGEYFLAVDIGNTHTVIGLFQDDYDLLKDWRIRTNKEATSDELAVSLDQLCRLAEIELGDICDVVISCVVPPLIHSWEELSLHYVKKKALVVQENIPVGMPILYKHPYEVGADRLVNSLAAYSRYKNAVIIVDYGTATTFDCVSSKGEYLGGSIAPGLLLAAEALFKGTSRLPRVELFAKPETAMGQDTASAIKAGIIYGFAGLTDGIIGRLLTEFAQKPRVIATGGLAPIIVPHCYLVETILPNLILEGLLIIYKRFKATGG
jgi:type III pantothenate kinase